MAVRKRIEVFFDGAVIGTIEVEVRHPEARDEAVAQCLAILGLLPCRDQDVLRRCPLAEGLHTHIPRGLFDDEPPIKRGDHIYLIATLPIVGAVSYNFDADHPVAPAMTFREAAL